MNSCAASIDVAELLQVRTLIDRLLSRTAPSGPLAENRIGPAILHVLYSAKTPISVAQIHSELLAGGYRPKSVHFRIRLHLTCETMRARGELIEIRRGGRKFFRASKNRKEAAG